MSKTLQELQAEKAAIESQLIDASRREDEQRRREMFANADRFEKQNKVRVGLSDDYAVMDSGNLDFYFGYEHTVCPSHGNDSRDCGECYCDESEWAFVVKDDGKETMRLGKSALHPRLDEPVEFLLCGIGLWIAEQRTPKERTTE